MGKSRVIFTPLGLVGAFVLDLEKRVDDRGFFAREWCVSEFARHGLCTEIAQINTGFSPVPGTLRGMHFQTGSDAEVKVVRCTRGAVFDVIIDLRPESATFCMVHGLDLTEENGRVLYVPKGFAHGYQTLRKDAEVQYLASVPYAPGSAQGVRFDDPRFGIRWPLEVTKISAQDRQWPYFSRDSAERPGSER